MDERVATKLKKLEEEAMEFPNRGCVGRAEKLLDFIRQEGYDCEARIAYVKPKRWWNTLYFKKLEIAWTHHCVVLWNGEVLDPSVGFPVPSDDYLSSFYGKSLRSPLPRFSDTF
ncbi:MAG TPA: hypothetical protein ENH99_00320 [Candidatus Pacearchaeota archaeon]|nr:hypothetical protein [Candidatus Pacearchaeota archaeon]